MLEGEATAGERRADVTTPGLVTCPLIGGGGGVGEGLVPADGSTSYTP